MRYFGPGICTNMHAATELLHDPATNPDSEETQAAAGTAAPAVEDATGQPAEEGEQAAAPVAPDPDPTPAAPPAAPEEPSPATPPDSSTTPDPQAVSLIERAKQLANDAADFLARL